MPNSSGGCNKRGGRAKNLKFLVEGGCNKRGGGGAKISKRVIPGGGTIRYQRIVNVLNSKKAGRRNLVLFRSIINQSI